MLSRLVGIFAASCGLLFLPACGDDSGGGGDPADAPGSSTDAPADAARPPPNFTIQSCGADPPTDAGPGAPDAGPDATPIDAAATDAAPSDGGTGNDAGMSWPGLDDPCCDPTGQCQGTFVCLVNRDDMSHHCRPRCTVGGSADQCPQPSRCLMFSDGTGVCVPAAVSGEECAPESCAAGFACVGMNADNAFCRSCCVDATQCAEGEVCSPLNPPPADCPMACVPQ